MAFVQRVLNLLLRVESYQFLISLIGMATATKLLTIVIKLGEEKRCFNNKIKIKIELEIKLLKLVIMLFKLNNYQAY